jgi:hypothetical protein
MSEYLIWSHEHGAWWKPARRGYTHSHSEAGRYSEAAARQIIADSEPGWKRGTVPPEMMIRVPKICIALTLDMAVAEATERMLAARNHVESLLDDIEQQPREDVDAEDGAR